MACGLAFLSVALWLSRSPSHISELAAHHTQQHTHVFQVVFVPFVRCFFFLLKMYSVSLLIIIIIIMVSRLFCHSPLRLCLRQKPWVCGVCVLFLPLNVKVLWDPHDGYVSTSNERRWCHFLFLHSFPWLLGRKSECAVIVVVRRLFVLWSYIHKPDNAIVTLSYQHKSLYRSSSTPMVRPWAYVSVPVSYSLNYMVLIDWMARVRVESMDILSLGHRHHWNAFN